LLLNFRYRFERKLGEGVYGDVYLAVDTQNEHDEAKKYVALKRQKTNNFNDKIEGYSIALLREINVL
jgi:serine/threonine protein kinase